MRHVELSLSSITLTHAEASGATAIACGMRPERSHAPASRDLAPSPASVRFVWPADRRHHPLPPRFFA